MGESLRILYCLFILNIIVIISKIYILLEINNLIVLHYRIVHFK